MVGSKRNRNFSNVNDQRPGEGLLRNGVSMRG